jgi:hypothetical protein
VRVPLEPHHLAGIDRLEWMQNHFIGLVMHEADGARCFVTMVVRPPHVTGEHILRALQPFEADHRGAGRLSVAELNLEVGVITVAHLKNGVGGPLHLTFEDKRALRRLKAETSSGRYVFLSERGDPLTRDAFAKRLAAIGRRAGLDRRLCHPHALGHAAGHASANGGRVNEYQLQAVMGHRDARSTRIYAQGVAGLIKRLWD